MIIDCHAHFEPRLLDTDAMRLKMDAAGVDRIALIPVINDPIKDTPTRLLSVMRALSRSAAGRLVVEAAHRALMTREGDVRVNGEVVHLYRDPDNAAVADVVGRHPDRFFGWIFLNPKSTRDALDELERWRASPGMIGIKLHPHWHDYKTELLTPILKRADELRLPVLVHLGFRKRGDFRAMSERFPRLQIICAHAGFPFYDDLWAAKRACPRLMVDLSSPYIDEALARDAVRELGPERCLFGTDAPYGFHEDDASYDYREIRRWVERMPVTTAQRERILGGNFEAILAR